jgi:Macrocin-O-methyltransferase (TylF)
MRTVQSKEIYVRHEWVVAHTLPPYSYASTQLTARSGQGAFEVGLVSEFKVPPKPWIERHEPAHHVYRRLVLLRSVPNLARIDLLLEKLSHHVAFYTLMSSIQAGTSAIGQISYPLLVCNSYRSFGFTLHQLYDQVSPGGFVLVDDYDHWKGTKTALDEFLSRRGIDVRLHRVPPVAVYFQKPAMQP